MGIKVTTTVEHMTLRWPPISACPPYFLVIGLHVFGGSIVNHLAYIWLVYTHTKCNCGSYYLIIQKS